MNCELAQQLALECRLDVLTFVEKQHMECLAQVSAQQLLLDSAITLKLVLLEDIPHYRNDLVKLNYLVAPSVALIESLPIERVIKELYASAVR